MVVMKVMGVPVVMAVLMAVFAAVFVIVAVPLTHLRPPDPQSRARSRRRGYDLMNKI